MRITWLLAASAVLLSATFPAAADDAMRRGSPKGISEAFYACSDRAAGDVVGLGNCITAEKKEQDGRLNKAYTALMAKLDANGKVHLRSAERAWIEFNARSVDTELDVRSSEKTANIDASVNEVYRYAERANTLEMLLSIILD